MSVTWFKRYRMQIELGSVLVPEAPTHDRYEFLPWHANLVGDHATAKYCSFRDELDSHVFPCLGNADGCRKLMKEIFGRKGFVPEATWLLKFTDPFNGHSENCGTVQGICDEQQTGSIQNLGIVPAHRGFGLGSTLLSYSLQGFRSAGIERVNLEVTAHNESALNLYRRLGFTIKKIVYKSIDLAYQ